MKALIEKIKSIENFQTSFDIHHSLPFIQKLLESKQIVTKPETLFKVNMVCKKEKFPDKFQKNRTRQ